MGIRSSLLGGNIELRDFVVNMLVLTGYAEFYLVEDLVLLERRKSDEDCHAITIKRDKPRRARLEGERVEDSMSER